MLIAMDTYLRDAAGLIGLIAALWGLYKGVFEFRLQGRQKRAETFLNKQAQYFGNNQFNYIRTLLEDDSPALMNVPVEEKRAYLTFFEEIAILRNSGLINEDLVFYMYGYYAAMCVQSEHFWSNIKKDRSYWAVFLGFAESMLDRLRDPNEKVSENIGV